MPVTMMGLVYYENDPERKIFRQVFPVEDDSELDNPTWVTERVNPNRKAVLTKVPLGSVSFGAMTGTP